MDDSQARAKPSLSGLVWVIPALVVFGNIGYALWVTGATHRGFEGLGQWLLFLFVALPQSALFLAVYAAAIARLRRSPRQLGVIAVVGLATLAGLVACALALGVLVGALALEAKLSAG